MHQNQAKASLNRALSPTRPGVLIQQVWGTTWVPAFLTSSQTEASPVCSRPHLESPRRVTPGQEGQLGLRAHRAEQPRHEAGGQPWKEKSVGVTALPSFSGKGTQRPLLPLPAADSLRDRSSPKWSNVFFPLGTSTVQYRCRTDTVCDYIQCRYPQNSTDAEQGSAQGQVTCIVSHRPKVSKALSLRPWEPSWCARVSGLFWTAFKSVSTSYPGGLTNGSTIKASQLSGLATSFRDNGSL